MTLAEALAGIGAILTALGGIFLIVRELSRRERRAADRQIDRLTKQVDSLRSDFLAYHAWAYQLTHTMTDAGLPVPPAPKPQPIAEDVDEPRARRWFRRRRE